MKNFQPRSSMRDTRVRYKFYPAESGRMVKLEISHRDGGRNYFSGANEKRGIEMCITTIEVAESGVGSGVMMETSSPMSDGNGRMLLMETARYSAKKLVEMVELFDARAPEISQMWATDRSGTLELLRTILSDEQSLAA